MPASASTRAIRRICVAGRLGHHVAGVPRAGRARATGGLPGEHEPRRPGNLYARLTRSGRLSYGAFTRARGTLRPSNIWSFVMLDLLYVLLGLAAFTAFVFGIRAAERL